MERRLAAILSIDLVGYSRMMGADEAGTFERLKTLRKEAIEPLIRKVDGRVVKLVGDGMLVMFNSTVDAVQCAIDIQAGVRDHNLSLPEAERMTFRMGINLGDVIFDDGDIYGDGVNVASRLEGIADPGSIVVSSAAIDSVRNKVTAGFEYLGERRLKNIEYPVGIYRIDTQTTPTTGLPRKFPASRLIVAGLIALFGIGVAVWLATSGGRLFEASEPVDAKSVHANSETALRSNVIETSPPLMEASDTSGDKPVIAVLPFTNFSNDEEQEYFSDGLTEDLITDISKISGVNVIARNSTFSFKGQSPDIRNWVEILWTTSRGLHQKK